ncbi:MAG TPA: hypothetical protein VFP12_04900 [Allosphingosinicella sp.]|nr:hypothetical protein [Allosphingosinicella sp.]
MFLPGISFSAKRPAEAAGLSSRADVAMFVGCVPRRAAAVPASVLEALALGGWSEEGLFRVEADRLDSLLDLPVPVHSWSEFDALYAWERRPLAAGSSDFVPTSLGLAVRSFFDEGGAKAWIVRTGDPPALDADEAAKLPLLTGEGAEGAGRVAILPGFRKRSPAADPGDPRTWSGAGAIFGVGDAAMLLLPDLVDICAGSPEMVEIEPVPPAPPEQFRPCAPAAPDLAPEKREGRPQYQAPRLDGTQYALWAEALRDTLIMLQLARGPDHRQDVMLLSAFPLPLLGEFERAEESRPLAILHGEGLFAEGLIDNPRLQLAYPWVRTAASLNMPEGVQSPEGLLAGIVARTSLADGAFRSIAGREARSVRGLKPEIGESDLGRGIEGEADWLGERLCLIANKRGRPEWLSDATLARERKWRTGGVSRLMGIVLRAARHFGDELMFEPSGPALWARIRGTVESFLDGLWRRGALDGASRDQAFRVECGETSMTAADVDSGRVIARIGFTAAYPIQHISVSLLLLEAAADGQAREAA